MPLWQLIVISTTSPAWAQSGYKGEKGPVIVRAPSAEKARDIVNGAFTLAGETRVGDDTRFGSVWWDDTQVRCERYADARYAEEGKDKVLFPDPMDW
jgi:hypothetical protein